MTIDLFLDLVVFAFVMSGMPGPNNVMLLASGVNYGFVWHLWCGADVRGVITQKLHSFAFDTMKSRKAVMRLVSFSSSG